MGKLQFSSALALGMLLAGLGSSTAQALSVEVREDLYSAINRVTIIKNEITRCGTDCKSIIPGIEDYLERLLADARVETEDEIAKQYIEALNDAEIAAPLMSGYKAHQTQLAKAQMNKNTVQAIAVTEETPEEQPTNPTSSSIAQTGTVDDPSRESAAVLAKAKTKTENKNEESVEVPATGKQQEPKKVGVGMLIVAGIAVVIATIGAAILIVRMKRDA